MQFSLPTTPTDLLPVSAPVASGADTALLTPTGEGAAPAEFAAVLDGQTAAPMLLPFAIAANPLLVATPAPAPVSLPVPSETETAPVTPAVVSAVSPVVGTTPMNVLTAPAPNPLVAPRVDATARNVEVVAAENVASQEAPTTTDASAETATSVSAKPEIDEPVLSRPMSPRPSVRLPRAATRLEEEQAAALSFAANVQTVAVQPVAVLTFDVSPTGEIAPAVTPIAKSADEISPNNAVLDEAPANVFTTLPSQTQTMRAAQAFWTKNNYSTPTAAAPVSVPVEEGAVPADVTVPQSPTAEPSTRIASPQVNFRPSRDALTAVQTEETPLPVVQPASPSLPAPLSAPAPVPLIAPAPSIQQSSAPLSWPTTTENQMVAQTEATPTIPAAQTEMPTSLVVSPEEIEAAVASTQIAPDASAPSGVLIPKTTRDALRIGAEKFSTSLAQTESVAASTPKSPGLKKILSAAQQVDSEVQAALGIGLADERGKMRNDSQPPFAAFQQVEEISVASSAVAGLREAIATLTPTPEVAPAAAPRVQSVVNYIVEAAQRLDTHTVSSMDLRFNFGANDKLSVRVELRDGSVHTTFRTDSSVLRETIGNAWREMAPANTISEGRTVRLADPTIIRESSSAEFSANAGTSDHRASQQHHQQTAEFAQTSFALAAGRNRVVRRVAALVEPVVAPLALRPETSRHLHAVA